METILIYTNYDQEAKIMNVWEMQFALNWMKEVENSLQEIAKSLEEIAETTAREPEHHEPEE